MSMSVVWRVFYIIIIRCTIIDLSLFHTSTNLIYTPRLIVQDPCYMTRRILFFEGGRIRNPTITNFSSKPSQTSNNFRNQNFWRCHLQSCSTNNCSIYSAQHKPKLLTHSAKPSVNDPIWRNQNQHYRIRKFPEILPEGRRYFRKLEKESLDKKAFANDYRWKKWRPRQCRCQQIIQRFTDGPRLYY